MSQKNETLPLILALLMTGGIIGGGWWWFSQKSTDNIALKVEPAKTDGNNSQQNLPTSIDNLPTSPKTNSSNSSNSSNTFNLPQRVASGTLIKVNGSTSMVQINQGLQKGFEGKYSGTTVKTNAQGSGVGIDLLKSGQIDVAAISRPLKSSEKSQGLKQVAIAKDAIAIVVGIDNPFRRGLKPNQVADIFQGRIDNWSQLGGGNNTIKVINRPAISGTHQIFKKAVLNDNEFGSGRNFTTLERDATTPILKMLKQDGISYATFAQVANQRTVRTVAINGLTPEADNYPYSRVLYYAYQEPASPEVRAFLGYVLSPQGQAAIVSGG